MKMKRLLLILLTIFSLGNIAVHAEKVNDCIKIVLQQTVSDDPPIKKDGGPIVRSIYVPVVDAYLYNNVVNVSFNENIAVVNVIVTNETTGETVYSETSSNPVTLNIDLNGENAGIYFIEIEMDSTCMQGSFSL
ncbi:conserved domain protein [Bacteroides fluxus YIT 12057]|uniref:Conserved domain protein n=2 Tax=Bacteroides fluxus TaxID=626930 RepID=F3PW60_9BACE|nr:conserved domain protein [Bacteroides fluxus YIT 12057]